MRDMAKIDDAVSGYIRDAVRTEVAERIYNAVRTEISEHLVLHHAPEKMQSTAYNEFRAGKIWSEVEDATLRERFTEFADAAGRKHGRTAVAIELRILKILRSVYPDDCAK
jgi:hypothetical protein